MQQVNPAKLFFYAYLMAILVGGFLLSTPLASEDGVWTSLIDTIFTATSAVCVTGLATLVTATYWSVFGKIVILVLIQLGGIGVVTVASAVGLLINRRFSMQERMYIAEEKNASSMHGMIKLVKYVLTATLIIESIGALLLSFQFIPEFGVKRGIAFSIFHSISAFCNAGFDIIGDASLTAYQANALVSFTIASLIIIGGLGFVVYQDILNKKRFKYFSLHTKLVISSTAFLIIGSTILFLMMEWHNPDTLGSLDTAGKLIAANFQSVTPRTAGFFSIDQGSLHPASLILTTVLMFIGGAPAGTAGGLKITTLIALIFGTVTSIRRKSDSKMFGRRLPHDTINKAITIFFLSIAWISLVVFALSISDSQLALSDIVFEVVSAYGTVGLTRGITPMLSVFGKAIIAFTMLFGKLGPITMVYLVARTDGVDRIKYAEETILVG